MALFCAVNELMVVPMGAELAVSDVIAVGAPFAVAPPLPPA
jgi:hypothetical protein